MLVAGVLKYPWSRPTGRWQAPKDGGTDRRSGEADTEVDPMRINQNVMAFNAYRNLSGTGVELGKSLETVSYTHLTLPTIYSV